MATKMSKEADEAHNKKDKKDGKDNKGPDGSDKAQVPNNSTGFSYKPADESSEMINQNDK
jgi:hypothetical protein